MEVLNKGRKVDRSSEESQFDLINGVVQADDLEEEEQQLEAQHTHRMRVLNKKELLNNVH